MRGAKSGKTSSSRHLRGKATIAEQRLWNRVRSRAIGGMKFVRQEPIGPYIVDLVCREQRLIIEIDGGQHATSERDAVRDQWLRDHHYRVLRYWNNDVMRNIEGVSETIADALHAERPPHPVPADGGDRPLPARSET